MHIDKPQCFLEDALWTDEMELELYGRSNQLCAQMKRNGAFNEKNIVPTVKHRRGLFMFWLLCCIWYLVALNLCKAQWIVKIIKGFCGKMHFSVSESSFSVKRSLAFQHDNDPKSTQKLLETKHCTILKWPSMGPDLSSTKHLWGELNCAV